MAGTFKFLDFLSKEEKQAFRKLQGKLGGRVIYIPYPEKDNYRDILKKRNRKIQRMFSKYKRLGLSDRVIYAEISNRLTCAKDLSMIRIRAIIKGYGRRINERRGKRVER